MKDQIQKVHLLLRSISQLKPVQICGQIKRLFRKGLPRQYSFQRDVFFPNLYIPELDEDSDYLSNFDINALMKTHDGKPQIPEVELLHERHPLTESWYEPTASHLWNYNLHYLEFTVPLAVKYRNSADLSYKQRWLEIIQSWIRNVGKSSDAYAPYTISLRLVNLLIGMELIGEFSPQDQREIINSLYSQYRYLQTNLETALLANHYFENLKALVIGSILFDEADDYHRYFRLFLRQIDEQILTDGLHYERSLMYHRIVLEDIIRVYQAILAGGHFMDAEKLLPVIRMMAVAATSIQRQFPRTPLFNDAGENVGKPLPAIVRAYKELLGTENPCFLQTAFPDAGYYRLDHDNIAVLVDCGDIGPGYMAGHAHNDCLSFELCVGEQMVFINSGTGQYQGTNRAFFRSTAAHNTVMVDDHEQNELWGEHRCGRRGTGHRVRIEKDRLDGRFRTYVGDGIHRRFYWKDHSLIITDHISSRGVHTGRQFLHLAPGLRFNLKDQSPDSISVMEGDRVLAIITGLGDDYKVYTKEQDEPFTLYAQDFGKFECKQVLEIRTLFTDTMIHQIDIRFL